MSVKTLPESTNLQKFRKTAGWTDSEKKRLQSTGGVDGATADSRITFCHHGIMIDIRWFNLVTKKYRGTLGVLDGYCTFLASYSVQYTVFFFTKLLYSPSH